jgi:hypothetical protein
VRVHVIIAGGILFIACFFVEVSDSRFQSVVHLLCPITRFITGARVLESPVTTLESRVSRERYHMLVPVLIMVQPPTMGPILR